jgi:hypothetical protein
MKLSVKNKHNRIVEKATLTAIENVIQETVISISTPKVAVKLVDTFMVETKSGKPFMIYFFRYGSLENGKWIIYVVPEGGVLNSSSTEEYSW